MLYRISTRALLLGAVLFSFSLAPTFAGEDPPGDGNPGDTVTESAGSVTESPGGSGSDGFSEHTNGYNGGDGGDITITTDGSESISSSNSIGEGVSVVSSGGRGGEGAPAEEPCESDCSGVPAPNSGGDGGNGGNGGDIHLTLENGTAAGGINASSKGGEAGLAAEDVTASEAKGGNGGEVTVVVKGNASVVGDVVAESLGGKSNMTDGSTKGHGGDVTVTISGTVEGNVKAESAGDANTAGKINVVLDGGVVTGTISADSRAQSTLTFDFDVADQNEFNAATAALLGEAAEGTVKINSKTYEWSGFDTLVNLLRYTGPNDKVTVSVESTNTVGNAPQTAAAQSAPPPQTPAANVPVPMLIGDIPLIVGQPEMAKCSGGSEIRTVRLDTGSLVVIHRTNGADALIGELSGGEFHRATGAPDWTIDVTDQGKSVQVTDASGGALTSCSFS